MTAQIDIPVVVKERGYFSLLREFIPHNFYEQNLLEEMKTAANARVANDLLGKLPAGRLVDHFSDVVLLWDPYKAPEVKAPEEKKAPEVELAEKPATSVATKKPPLVPQWIWDRLPD